MKVYRINPVPILACLFERGNILLLTPADFVPLGGEEYADAADIAEECGLNLLYIPRLLDKESQGVIEYFLPETIGIGFPDAGAVQERIIAGLGIDIQGPATVKLEGDDLLVRECDSSEDCIADIIRDFDAEETGMHKDASFEKCCDIDFRVTGEDLYWESVELDKSEDYALEDMVGELRQIKEDELRRLGLSENALRFLAGLSEPKLSRVKVTRNAKILLEDYGNMEIKLDDKTKALYLLYLRHPEGIAIKDLRDYYDELLDLYQSISGRDDPQAMRRTIDNLVTPIQNDANISLSRIKKAFCEAVAPQIASKYYVDGVRGEARTIALDRGLVTFESIR